MQPMEVIKENANEDYQQKAKKILFKSAKKRGGAF